MAFYIAVTFLDLLGCALLGFAGALFRLFTTRIVIFAHELSSA
jgi:hypothetical protein